MVFLFLLSWLANRNTSHSNLAISILQHQKSSVLEYENIQTSMKSKSAFDALFRRQIIKIIWHLKTFREGAILTGPRCRCPDKVSYLPLQFRHATGRINVQVWMGPGQILWWDQVRLKYFRGVGGGEHVSTLQCTLRAKNFPGGVQGRSRGGGVWGVTPHRS